MMIYHKTAEKALSYGKRAGQSMFLSRFKTETASRHRGSI